MKRRIRFQKPKNWNRHIKSLFAALMLTMSFFASCKNPMVNYLLGEQKKTEEWIDTSPVAWWNGTWYYSLTEAINAANDGTAAVPSSIEIRRDITRFASMGGDGIIVPTGKFIQLKPRTPDAAIITMRRWEAGGAFFTVESGASLTLDAGMIIDGARIVSSGPLVMVKAGAAFTMDDGSLVTRGRSSGPGGGVYVDNDMSTTFTMKGSARVTDTDVYLETGAKITIDGILSANPVARITPQVYPDTATPLIQVLDGGDIANIDGDGIKNNEKFDVSPENVAGWSGPRHWRVDDNGELYVAVARRFAAGLNIYYPTLQDAFDAAIGVSAANFETVTLIANIELDAADAFDVDSARYIRLT
ncbi:MAG: hypothetical protein LBH35_10070, partial [Treponema sp.]|nr:hypothetical protein [Treponema sp.]